MKNRDRKIVVAGCFSWVLMLAALFFLILAIREYAPFYLNDRKMDQLQKDIGFIAAFTRRMACAACCPVARVIPDNVKKDLDEYLFRKRKDD